jgi:hypothetical protein
LKDVIFCHSLAGTRSSRTADFLPSPRSGDPWDATRALAFWSTWHLLLASTPLLFFFVLGDTFAAACDRDLERFFAGVAGEQVHVVPRVGGSDQLSI